jgi:hypothetical protein
MATETKIVEQYFEYSPPVRVYGSVRLLLRGVPEEYLSGLHKVTLTNSARQRRLYRGKRWADNRRFRVANSRGFYRNGQIELSIDQILLEYPELFLLFPPFKNFLIAQTLYHEIGHHIHKLQSPGFRNGEEFADEWRDKLLRVFLRRYWYLAPVFRICFTVARPFRRSKPADASSLQDTA